LNIRESYSTEIKVILMRNQTSKSVTELEIQERIAAAERLVGIASKNTMTLEEIRNERLTRQ
jgi:hypothetical protein